MSKAFDAGMIFVSETGYKIEYIADENAENNVHAAAKEVSMLMGNNGVVTEEDINVLRSKIKKEPYLVPTGSKSQKTLSPINDSPSAFINFINLSEEYYLSNDDDQLNKNVLKFADTYGLLCDQLSDKQEPISFWLSMSKDMSFVYALYQAIKANDINLLERYISFNDSDQSFYLKEFLNYQDTETGFIDERRIQPTNLEPVDTVKQAAWHFLSIKLSRRLQYAISGATFTSEGSNGLTIEFMAQTLKSALWLQLAKAITRSLEYKQCLECDEFFEVKTKKRRFERIYCSDKCNKRAAARLKRERKKAWILACANGYKGTLAEYIAEQKEETK